MGTARTPAHPSTSTRFVSLLRAKLQGGLYVAGATLAVLMLVLPHSADAIPLGLLAIAGVSYAVGAFCLWRAERLPPWAASLALALGTTLIVGAAYCSGESPSPLVFLLLWIFLYAAYFLSDRQMTVQIVFVGAMYGALLAARPPAAGSIAAWWIVGTGTATVTALAIRAMRNRVEQLIGRLYDTARTDPLTQLLNRRGFRELLDLELERARRSGALLTVIVGDVDHFKAVNDRSGHHVGDVALQRVAGLLEQGKRSIDAAARVGGEEFALILPDTDEDGGEVLAERLRCELREQFAADPVPITISFGVASFPAHGETAASLLRSADEALYAAKDSGRNRTVIHYPGLRGHGAQRGEDRDVESERFLAMVLETAESFDLRFSGSARHSETVGRYAETMARELGLSEQRVGRVRLAGLLHDIGKVGVDKDVLLKPGKLDEAEFAEIRRHPQLGARMLDHPSLADIQAWVLAHHERPDGRGYPFGLAREDVPLEARILAVADAYEAMTSDRVYRASIGRRAAREELLRGAGTQFDARVVRAFLAALERESLRAAVLVGSY